MVEGKALITFLLLEASTTVIDLVSDALKLIDKRSLFEEIDFCSSQKQVRVLGKGHTCHTSKTLQLDAMRDTASAI